MIIVGLNELGEVVGRIHMEEAVSFREVTGDEAIDLGHRFDGTKFVLGKDPKEVEAFLAKKMEHLRKVRLAKTPEALDAAIKPAVIEPVIEPVTEPEVEKP